MRTNKRNIRPKSKMENIIDEAMIEMTDSIEGIFNPHWILLSSNGDAPMDVYNIHQQVENLTHLLFPGYEKSEKKYEALLQELEKQLPGNKFNQTGGIDNEVGRMRVWENDAWFGTGCLFGMKLAGKPMEEIKKMASSILSRCDREARMP